MEPGEHGVDPEGDILEPPAVIGGEDRPPEPSGEEPPDYDDWVNGLPSDFPEYDPYEP